MTADEEMRALSLWQPWASLIAVGAKTIETRSWSTKYRGPLLIHAARRPPDTSVEVGEWIILAQHMRSRETLEAVALSFGAIVATCTLVDCVPIIGTEECGVDLDAPEHVCASFGTLLHHRPRSDPFDDGATELDVTNQLPYGDFTPSRFAWLLVDIAPLPEPVPMRGHQGLWKVQRAEVAP